MRTLFSLSIDLVERRMLPDRLVRLAIRRMLARQLAQRGHRGDAAAAQDSLRALLAELRASPIALHTQDANTQHYEVPTAFFQEVLGKRLKYSSCYWPSTVHTLDAAEEAMLRLTGERAQLEDGMTILELGCGWGSLSLWLAENYPRCQVVAVSNSATQREHIMAEAEKRGFGNVEVITADMNTFQTERRFDRVMSIEMFEHMRNYECLMQRIAAWLVPGGKLFVHIFAHRQLAYTMNTANNWMARYFFAGGMIPSDALLLYFQQDLRHVDHWCMSGLHYARTLEAWLRTMDEKIASIKQILRSVYGERDLDRWIARWRLFFLASAELMSFRGGNEYIISHYLFEKPPSVA